MKVPKLIEFNNVSVEREGNLALRGVTFSIEAGEHVAILGPNGCGKSTLLKVVTRDCYPRYPLKSSVKFWGEDTWTLFDLRSTMGIVTNDLVNLCTQPYSGMETVLSAFFGSIGVWPYHHVTPKMEKRAKELLKFFDVDHLADRLMTEISSGEARRIVFARALAHDPKALILDEPTNSLDVRAQREVRESMRRLVASGVTVIVVTHHLPDIIPEINRVVALKAGKIFFDGAKDQVLNSEKMTELFETPVNVRQVGDYFDFGMAE